MGEDAGSSVENRSLAFSPVEVLLHPNGHWLQVGPRIHDLARKPILRRLVATLARHSLSTPDVSLPTASLVEQVWLNDAASWQSLTTRLSSAVRQLRRLGVGPHLISDSEGYRLSAHVRVADQPWSI